MTALSNKEFRLPVILGGGLLWEWQDRVRLGVGHGLVAGGEIWRNQEDMRVRKEQFWGPQYPKRGL